MTYPRAASIKIKCCISMAEIRQGSYVPITVETNNRPKRDENTSMERYREGWKKGWGLEDQV